MKREIINVVIKFCQQYDHGKSTQWFILLILWTSNLSVSVFDAVITL